MHKQQLRVKLFCLLSFLVVILLTSLGCGKKDTQLHS